MDKKRVKSRFVHKHDTEANWLKATKFIPLQAELIVYDVDENYDYERFKFGDGKTLVNDLPFATEGIDTSLFATAETVNMQAAEIQTIKNQIADILYEPISVSECTISDIKATSAGATKTVSNPVEKGSVVNELTVSWTISKSNPVTLTINDESLNVEDRSKTYINLNLTSGKYYDVVATDDRGATSSKRGALSFANWICYGVAAQPNVINSDFVMSLAKKISTTKARTFAVDATEGLYIWYCLPTELKECNFTDTETQLAAGMSLVGTIEVQNTSHYTESYYVYRSDYSGLGNLSIKVS